MRYARCMQSWVNQIFVFWPESLHWMIVPWGWLCILIGGAFITLISIGVVRHVALSKPIIDRASGLPASPRLVIFSSVLFLGVGGLLLSLGVEIAN